MDMTVRHRPIGAGFIMMKAGSPLRRGDFFHAGIRVNGMPFRCAGSSAAPDAHIRSYGSSYYGEDDSYDGLRSGDRGEDGKPVRWKFDR